MLSSRNVYSSPRRGNALKKPHFCEKIVNHVSQGPNVRLFAMNVGSGIIHVIREFLGCSHLVQLSRE